MKTTILSFALVAVMLGTMPVTASEFGAGSHIAGFALGLDPTHDAHVFERRGRGRGHTGDDDRGSDVRVDGRRGGGGGRLSDVGPSRSSNDDHGGGRSSNGNDNGHCGRPRVPGGSGCDDAGDAAEHPECRI